MVCIIIYLYIFIYSASLFSEETAGRKTSAMISYINLISSELFARVHLKILKKKNSIESYQINEASIEDMGAAQCFLMRKSRIIWSIKSLRILIPASPALTDNRESVDLRRRRNRRERPVARLLSPLLDKKRVRYSIYTIFWFLLMTS